MIFITNIDWTDTTLPLGGVTEADYGRELGEMGIQQCANNKWERAMSMPALVSQPHS
ncbi:hypothetical protein RJP56_18350 [Shewanella baltica]|uniref:hypothetical protein n=1 Tax=Shewanella baltica TaxID=62322 RepID=UPI0028717529|nr:hypothetical protein [Shewanella baltica]MDR9768025.1 hypothetical protein [Shewanella baltica]